MNAHESVMMVLWYDNHTQINENHSDLMLCFHRADDWSLSVIASPWQDLSDYIMWYSYLVPADICNNCMQQILQHWFALNQQKDHGIDQWICLCFELPDEWVDPISVEMTEWPIDWLIDQLIDWSLHCLVAGGHCPMAQETAYTSSRLNLMFHHKEQRKEIILAHQQQIT